MIVLAAVISALITFGSFAWFAVVSRKRALKMWEAMTMHTGMMYGAVVTGLLISTLL